VERALLRPLPGGPFDLIVLDPPYDYAHLADAVANAGTQRAADGIVILEHASRVTPPQPPGLSLTRTVKSGDSALSFYS
jgi:16S rRNA G966 N2-methylase RsmD